MSAIRGRRGGRGRDMSGCAGNASGSKSVEMRRPVLGARVQLAAALPQVVVAHTADACDKRSMDRAVPPLVETSFSYRATPRACHSFPSRDTARAVALLPARQYKNMRYRGACCYGVATWNTENCKHIRFSIWRLRYCVTDSRPDLEALVMIKVPTLMITSASNCGTRMRQYCTCRLQFCSSTYSSGCYSPRSHDGIDLVQQISSELAVRQPLSVCKELYDVSSSP